MVSVGDNIKFNIDCNCNIQGQTFEIEIHVSMQIGVMNYHNYHHESSLNIEVLYALYIRIVSHIATDHQCFIHPGRCPFFVAYFSESGSN